MATTHPVHSVSAFKPDAGLGDPGRRGSCRATGHQQERRVSRLEGEKGGRLVECLHGACHCAFSHLIPRTPTPVSKQRHAHLTGEKTEVKPNPAGPAPPAGHYPHPLVGFPSSFPFLPPSLTSFLYKFTLHQKPLTLGRSFFF